MKVLLLNPPFKSKYGRFSREQRSPAITKSGTLYYPMWLAYAAGVLEKAGHLCKLIDAPAEGLDLDGLIGKIGDSNPNLIVVGTSTPSIYNDIEVGVKLKQRYRAFVVLVGTHVSALPRETLECNTKIDAVAVGEYEQTIDELAAVLENTHFAPGEDDLRKVAGISFRLGDKIIGNQNRKFIEELDSIPFVAKVYKKHLDYRKYFYAHSRYPIVTIITGRGCPFRCVYCVYPQVFSGHKVRYRSVASVVDEIEYILKEFPNVKEIMFEDDTLTLNKRRCFEFAEEILKRNLEFVWSANSRADVDFETMKILKKAGVRLFCVGVESGVQGILDNIKKNLNIGRIRQFFEDTKKAGVLIHGCFLVGGPGETKETLDITLNFAKELNPDTAQFFPIMVYPGTEAYNWASENNYLKSTDFKEWLTPEGLHNCVLCRPGLTNDDLVEFCNRARREFYLRPRYVCQKLIMGMKDVSEFKRLLKGARNLFKSIWK